MGKYLGDVVKYQMLTLKDMKDKYHMIRYTAHFNFREHLCISTELLGINLYELIKLNKFTGLPVKLVQHFAKQLLEGLRFLDHKDIIHCDLKPENILLSDPDRGLLKIIDFGSSCYATEKVYTYIQSRFYRSPEVILGMVYNQRIDMWSLGCILAELLTGHPLFMGENEQEQIACIMEIFGVPEKFMISQCSRRKLFFDSVGNPRIHTSSKKVKRYPGTKSLKKVLKTDNDALVDFLSQCLVWNPKHRLAPYHGLYHEFITGGGGAPQAVPTRPLGARKASHSSINSMSSTTLPVLEPAGYAPLKVSQPQPQKEQRPLPSVPLEQINSRRESAPVAKHKTAIDHLSRRSMAPPSSSKYGSLGTGHHLEPPFEGNSEHIIKGQGIENVNMSRRGL